jgi:hypothetical protein
VKGIEGAVEWIESSSAEEEEKSIAEDSRAKFDRQIGSDSDTESGYR